jgi:glycerophosphoryl diester phosphodiesterase
MPLDRPARHPFLDHPGPIPFAHRGGAGDWPENTMPAFAAAIALGFRYLETDVQATSDGVLVAFHDDDLSRTCGRPGLISALPWSEVSTARVDGKEPIPLFDDLFTTFPNCRINVDCKTDAAVGPLIESLRRANALDRVCVGCFSHARLRRLRSALGSGLCSSMSPLEVARWRLGFPSSAALVAQVPVRHSIVPIVTQRMVDLAHRRAIDVHVWTIDEPAEMLRLLEMHVDGIMTDRPAVLKQVLTQRGEWA